MTSIQPPSAQYQTGVTLRFSSGTVEVHGLLPGSPLLPASGAWDPRAACYRAPAVVYAEVVRALIGAEVPFADEARRYDELELGLRIQREPRPYQTAALAAWRRGQRRGVVVLPTGAGKSHLALMALAVSRRSALIIAPTLDLVRQWYDLLRTGTGLPVGVIGGGEYAVLPLTVTTYDSAYLHMEHLGNRFGLVVFDECHHLPGQAYLMAAQCCLAPFRRPVSPHRCRLRPAGQSAGGCSARDDLGDFCSDTAPSTPSLSLHRGGRTDVP